MSAQKATTKQASVPSSIAETVASTCLSPTPIST